MDWRHLLALVLLAPLVFFVVTRFTRRKGQAETFGETLGATERALLDAGFELVEKTLRISEMSSLRMVRHTDPEISFQLGYAAVRKDRPDLKLLGEEDHQIAQSWWVHMTVTLPAGQRFPLFALRRLHKGAAFAWKRVRAEQWPVEKATSGDARFDELFELYLEDPSVGAAALDAATRAQILSLEKEPYFANLLFLVSPHQPNCLLMINPPLPSARTASVAVAEAVARRLAGLQAPS